MLWFCRVLDGSMRISGQSWPRSPLNCGREVGTGNETYIYVVGDHDQTLFVSFKLRERERKNQVTLTLEKGNRAPLTCV